MRSGILIDFDDTLVETTVFFNQAKNKFATLMSDMGFPADLALTTLNELDIKNVQQSGGFYRDCFPRALGETYEYYCQVYGCNYNIKTRQEIEDLGWWVYRQPARPIQGAEKVLEQLAGRYPLFLATKGETKIQKRRVEQSGLSQWFEKIYVLSVKNTAAYTTIAREQKISPMLSWVVGNSMKSDINPALQAGFNCIYIHHPHTWDFEDEEPLGGHISVDSLTGILEFVT
jgi:putative hydrolase of the HAD superfamily